MKLIKFLCILAIILSSCANKKDIIYLQDYKNANIGHIDFIDYVIKPGDILKIDLKTDASFSKDLIFDSNQNFPFRKHPKVIFFRSIPINRNR